MILRLVNRYANSTKQQEQQAAGSQCSSLTFCLKDEDCWDYDISQQNNQKSRTGQCWMVVIILISFGALLVLIAEVQGRKKKFKKFRRIVLRAREAIVDTIDDVGVSFSRLSSKAGGHGSTVSLSLQQQQEENDDWEYDDGDESVNDGQGKEHEQDVSETAFVTTLRTEKNFIKDTSDKTLVYPKMYPAEYIPRGVESTVLPVSGFLGEMWHLAISCNLLISVYLGSTGWAMICSGFSSLLWIVVDYERNCVVQQSYIEDWIETVGLSLARVRNDYDFYPVFLLIGYIGYVVQRWREFMVNCHECQAKIHDVALLVGGAVVGTPNLEMRKKLYRIYRYLNVIHALCYKSVSPTVGPLDIELDFVRSLRLLEVDEADELMSMGKKTALDCNDSVLCLFPTRPVGTPCCSRILPFSYFSQAIKSEMLSWDG
jgi:hypothetical protein